MSEKMVVVDESGVPDFVRLVHDPDRKQYVILVSTARWGNKSGEEALLDVVELHRRVGDRAIVAVLDNFRASYALSHRSDMHGLAAWGGAVRLLAPMAVPTGGTYPQNRLVLYCPNFLDVVVRALDQALDQGPDPSIESDRLVRDLQAQVAEKDRLVRDLQAQVAEKDRTIANLRKELQKAKKKIRSHTVSDDEPVWSDPTRQLDYEIREAWLRQVAEYDRGDYPLPENWVLGPDFITSMEEMTVVGRGVVVAAIVDVLTGRAATIPGRYLHAHRRGTSSNEQLIRRRDGAAAWRCAVRQALPSAPRLLWWRLATGEIELGRVVLHDDTYLR